MNNLLTVFLFFHVRPTFGNQIKISIGDWTLDINPVTLEDDARFQCQIGAAEAGIAPIRSRYATLSVLVPPNPPKMLGGSGQMADGQTIHKTVEGRQVELRCESRGGKPAAEVRNGSRNYKKNVFFLRTLLLWYRDLCYQLVYLCAIIDSYTFHLITKLHFVANKEQETRSAWYAMISYHREIYVLNLNYVCLNWVYTVVK